MQRKWLIIVLFVFILTGCHRTSPAVPQHAVIITYHRFGEHNLPALNVQLEQFQEQIQTLKMAGYHVLPVDVIIQSLQKDQPLFDKTIGIIIDDADESAYLQAFPRLRQADFPFTLMIAPQELDQQLKNNLTWEQIQQLAQQKGVTIGLRSSASLNKNDLQKAQNRLQQKLGRQASLFMYSEIDYPPGQEEVLKSIGIRAAFQQISGVMTAQSQFYALPQFSINESYSAKEYFSLIIQALPFNISELSPANPQLVTNPPLISFKNLTPNLSASSFSCYQNDVGKLPVTIDQNRIVITPNQPFTLSHTYINCTAADANKRWHWLALRYVLPDELAT